MSDALATEPVSALGGASFEGFARVREIGPLGMITLRARPGTKGLDKAVKAAVGTRLPAQRRMEWQDDRGCGWMSPDEFLLILPHAEVAAATAKLEKALAGQHFLAVDVSDARAVFRIEGERAAQVLAKLCPVDFDRLEPGELRRTRAAQVAVAFWAGEGGFTLVSFRSVADYVMGLLAHSARPGSDLG